MEPKGCDHRLHHCCVRHGSKGELTYGQSHGSPADMVKCLAKPKAKLLPTPNKNSMAAKSYNKILDEHKSRSRGKWGELAGARASCSIEAPHQGKILPAKMFIITAMEIQQNLLAGSYWLSTHLFCLTSREVTQPRLQQWRDRQSPFLHPQMETSFPSCNGSGSTTGLSKGQADGDQRLS